MEGFFLEIKLYSFDTTRAGMHARHDAVDRNRDPMDVYPDCPLGVGRPSFPLTARDSAVMFM